MKQIARYAAYLLLILASGCQALGLATPQTLNQKLAVGYGTVTSIVVATDTLLVGKKLTADDAANVQMQANNGKAALDIARTLSKTDTAAAATKLDSTITVLTALQAYLATKGN